MVAGKCTSLILVLHFSISWFTGPSVQSGVWPVVAGKCTSLVGVLQFSVSRFTGLSVHSGD